MGVIGKTRIGKESVYNTGFAIKSNIAQQYGEELRNTAIDLIAEADFAESVYHLFVIRIKNRDELIAYLKEKGIATGIHYPIPIHLQQAYKDLGYKKGDFPITEQYADEILSLPMYPELSSDQVSYVCDTIKEFIKSY